MTAAGDLGPARRAARRRAVQDFKRQAILEAAAGAFSDEGLDGATMRAIAERAGYAPATLYLHYDGKEQIYADLLGESLARLGRAVKAAAGGPADPRERARRALHAFFDHYQTHPEELELGLYLFRGARPRGLSRELDRKLNGRLIAALRPIAEALGRYGGLDQARANLETVDLVSHMVGCLILELTGRLKVLGHTAAALIERRISNSLDRLAPAPGPGATGSSE